MSYGVADIERRLRLGEDSHWGFKRIELRGDQPISPKRYAWSDGVAAFANAGGGIVLGEELHLIDVDENELSVRILAIKGRSVLVEHRLYPERTRKK